MGRNRIVKNLLNEIYGLSCFKNSKCCENNNNSCNNGYNSNCCFELSSNKRDNTKENLLEVVEGSDLLTIVSGVPGREKTKIFLKHDPTKANKDEVLSIEILNGYVTKKEFLTQLETKPDYLDLEKYALKSKVVQKEELENYVKKEDLKDVPSISDLNNFVSKGIFSETINELNKTINELNKTISELQEKIEKCCNGGSGGNEEQDEKITEYEANNLLVKQEDIDKLYVDYLTIEDFEKGIENIILIKEDN